MAVQRIQVQRTEQAENVGAALRLIREARDRLEYAQSVMEACIDSSASPADFAVLEQTFGVPDGEGETVYNLLAGTNSDLHTFNVNAAIARLG